MTTEAKTLITHFTSWEPTSINYGTVKINARGGKSLRIMDANNNVLRLNTPLMLTWGINKIVDESSGKESYNLALQFPEEKYGNASTTAFFEKIKSFEDLLLTYAVEHSSELFGRKMSKEVLEALYNPILRYPNIKGTNEPDYSRMPTMKIKIPYWEGKFNVELYDTNHESIFQPNDDIDDQPFESFIPKASHIASIIQCNGFWFVGGKFGVSFQMVQSIVKKPVRIQGSCFVTMNDEDKKQLDHLKQQEDDEEDETIDDVAVQDSDEEDVDVVPEIEQPKPKKRVVKRKTKTPTEAEST